MSIYRSIEALAMEGLAPVEISRRLGVPRDSVYSALRDARRAGRDIPKFPSGARRPGPNAGKRRVQIDPEVASALDACAEAYGMTASEVANVVLGRVARQPAVAELMIRGARG